MAKNMIDEVRKAEEQAAAIVDEANQRASEGLKLAKQKADELIKSTVSDAKKKAAVTVATAENNAFKVNTKSNADNVSFASDEIEKAKANEKKAIEAVISEIIPN